MIVLDRLRQLTGRLCGVPISPAGSFLIVQYHSVARLQEIERRVHTE